MADGLAASQVPARTGLRLGIGAGSFLVVAGWVIGLRPLADNSFFTHLATGRLILDQGSVPSTDPYTFSAHGASWLVQSWLASLLYATTERLGGATGLRVLMGVTAAILAALGWRLTRPAASIVPRLALGVVFVAASAELWAERPLMLGLIGFAAVMLAADGALDPRWLVPIGWLWVNVHGSFPLGVVYLAVVAAGRHLDGGRAVHELRALRWFVPGVLLGAIGPLGPRVLTFPIELLSRQDVLRNVIEWRAPTFDSLSQRVFLLQLVLVIVALVRRPSYRSGLVVAVFAAAALLGARNLTVASLVFLPVMATAAPDFGSLRSDTRAPIGTVLGAAGLAAAVLLGAARLGQRDFELRGYPIDAIAFLAHEDVDLAIHRMAAKDVVGNLLELLHGPGREVFYDDRFDMFPDDVAAAHLALVQNSPRLRADLTRLRIELVLLERPGATAQRMIVDPAWRVLFTDEAWVLACRRGSDLGGRLGVC